MSRIIVAGTTREFLDKQIVMCDVVLKGAFGPLGCGMMPTFVIVNMRQAGYIVVCRRHRDQWLAEFGQQPDKAIILTVAQFEEQRRKGLYTLFDIPTFR